jgi:hypothetical protein
MENAFEMIENLTEELGEKEQRIIELEKELKDAMRIIKFYEMNRPTRTQEIMNRFGIQILCKDEKKLNELSEDSYNELGKMLKTAEKNSKRWQSAMGIHYLKK